MPTKVKEFYALSTNVVIHLDILPCMCQSVIFWCNHNGWWTPNYRNFGPKPSYLPKVCMDLYSQQQCRRLPIFCSLTSSIKNVFLVSFQSESWLCSYGLCVDHTIFYKKIMYMSVCVNYAIFYKKVMYMSQCVWWYYILQESNAHVTI